MPSNFPWCIQLNMELKHLDVERTAHLAIPLTGNQELNFSLSIQSKNLILDWELTATADFATSIFIILAFYDSTLTNINIHNSITFLLSFFCIFTCMYSLCSFYSFYSFYSLYSFYSFYSFYSCIIVLA